LLPAVFLLLQGVPLLPAQAAGEPAPPELRLRTGYEIPAGTADQPPALPVGPIAEPASKELFPILVRLEANRPAGSPPGTEYEWTAMREQIDRFRAGGYEPVLALRDGGPQGRPDPADKSQVAAWEEFVRSAARAFGPSVRLWEVALERGAAGDVAGDVFLFKATSTTIRAETPAGTLVATAPLEGPETDRLQAFFDQGAGTYLDVVTMRLQQARDAGEQVALVAG
jgi:hypothetical protein